jgi:hypothetical protein
MDRVHFAIVYVGFVSQNFICLTLDLQYGGANLQKVGPSEK